MLMADGNRLFEHHISLMHGWIPVTAQLAAAAALIVAVSRRQGGRWLPMAAAVGVAVAVGAQRYVTVEGLAGDAAPPALWIWVGLTGFAAAVLVAGRRDTHRSRRIAGIVAVPLCMLCAALTLNLWVGYFPTVQAAWGQLTAGPLPDQTDIATVTAMQQRRAMPAHGSVVTVDTGSAGSGFKHRGELVYLPPAWFTSDPPPKLPTLMMIGGEFNTPADWLRSGDAIRVVDAFAATHGGNAPVLVFVDSGGTFNNDTECVNGPRGNVADHLTKDVVPAMVSKFGVSPAAANWGTVGWSMGGTCAVDLTVMHPDRFSVFEDIAGDLGPNSGTREQTIARLFGGNADAYLAFDPSAVITRHGRYSSIAGWFEVNGSATAPPPAASAADSLCALGTSHGIDCVVIARPGKHDWPFASRAFSDALPWLAGQIGTPGAPRTTPPAPIRGATTAQDTAADRSVVRFGGQHLGQEGVIGGDRQAGTREHPDAVPDLGSLRHVPGAN